MEVLDLFNVNALVFTDICLRKEEKFVILRVDIVKKKRRHTPCNLKDTARVTFF